LQSFIAFLDSDQKINPGDYYFDEPLSLVRVAYMFANDIHNVAPIKITFPEGYTNTEIAQRISEKLPNFNSVLFLENTTNLQGKLFPSTYFFYALSTPDEMIEMLSDTFAKQTNSILAKGYKNYSQNEILTMASIVEEEANGEEDRAIIAGILWKRLDRGMLLQVDAEPSTYKVKGLPSSPISNPGLASIQATVNPEESTYLFYLHDKNGMIHLAKDFAEHKKNVSKFLR